MNHDFSSFIRALGLAIIAMFCATLTGQNQDSYFLQDYDFSGSSTIPRFQLIEDKANEIANFIPDVYQENFQVVDGGAYYLNNYSGVSITERFDARFDELKQEVSAFLFIGRLIKESGRTEFYTRIKLDTNDQYPCVTLNSVSGLEQQVSFRMNQVGSQDFILGELEGLETFVSQVLSITECCQLSNKSGDPTLCEACTLEPSISDFSGIGELENIILADGNRETEGVFFPLRNINVNFNGFRYSDLLDSEVPILTTEIASHAGIGTFDIIEGLEELKQSAIDLGKGDSVRVDVRYYNSSNCNDLTTFIRDSPEGNRSFPNGFSEYSYDEQLIVLHIDGEIIVYSRIFSKLPSSNFSSFKYSEEKQKALIIPALIAREIIKRAAMGAINVFIELGISTVIEKVFSAPLDCGEDTCSEDTWEDAWTRYRHDEFSNGRYAVWKILIIFAEGAIDPPPIFGIISSGLQPALKYLFTGVEPPGFRYIEPSDKSSGFPLLGMKSANFSFGRFFRIFIKEATTAAAFQGILKWGGKVIKAIKKVRSRNFPASQLSSDCNFGLLWNLFLDPDKVGVWQVSYKANLPISSRRSVALLEDLK
jgi:hypothetical protein